MIAARNAPWPTDGVVRVHPAPMELPAKSDQPGPYRFDDPRPRTEDRFVMRYTALTIRGCLLELLDWMRDNQAATARESEVDVDDPDLVEPPTTDSGSALEAYLLNRRVARMTTDDPHTVSINDPELQHDLDREPAVRAVLDSQSARDALLEANGQVVHLDNGAVRLASETGRDITRACALALYDRPEPPEVIHFRSRHDDSEDCWAIYDHTPVERIDEAPFSPETPAHHGALMSVATMWDLDLPASWSRPPPEGHA